MNDLEWMARNVHEVPSYCKTISVVRLDSGEGRPFFHHDLCGTHSTQEWQAERARLQNKPSWDGMDTRFDYIAQDEDGLWCAFDRKPICYSDLGEWKSGGTDYATSRGEVLGYWDDTLECRPEYSLYEVTTSNSDKYMLTDAPEPKKEWRGPEDGLPPIGSCVEYFDAVQEIWKKQYIVAHHVCGEQAIFSESIDGGDLYYGVPTDFRPLRTEEDKAIRDMLSIVQSHYAKSRCIFPDTNLSDDNWISYLMALYDAGYRKKDASE